MKKILGLFYVSDNQNKPRYVKIVNVTLVLIVVAALLVLSYRQTIMLNLVAGQSVWDKFSTNMDKLYQYRSTIIRGFRLTILISIASLFMSLLFGIIAALSIRSKFQPIHYASKVYIEIVRGTPLLVQIIAIYYFIGVLFKLNDKFLAGVIILSLFEGAYISEIIRAGIESIPRVQIETARSLCLNTRQKYIYIILPQVVKRVLPPLTGQFASLVKDSSLLSIIALGEFTLSVQNVTALNYNYTEGYILLGVGYLILTFTISRISKHLERRYLYEA